MINMELKIKNLGKNYFIEFKFEGLKIDHNFQARLLNINMDEYRNKLINEFNGLNDNFYEICFTNKDDAKNAMEWINSIIIMNKIIDDGEDLERLREELEPYFIMDKLCN